MVIKNNKGFSLVELIVILAIMAILSVGAASMIYSWKSWNVSDTVQKLDVGLSDAKVDCMSKNTGGLRIYKDTDDLYYMSVSGKENEKLGDEHVKIYYSDTNGNTDVEIDGATELNIAYNRGTGGFKEIGINGAGENVYCKEIKVTRGNNTMIIKLERLTGNHYIEK